VGFDDGFGNGQAQAAIFFGALPPRGIDPVEVIEQAIRALGLQMIRVIWTLVKHEREYEIRAKIT
jgi:hypothetical protein